MPWDDIKAQAERLNISMTWSELEKQAALAALHATPDNLNNMITMLSAANLGLVFHLCAEPPEPGAEPGECEEYDAPTSVKLLLIYALMALRDRELAKKEKSA